MDLLLYPEITLKICKAKQFLTMMKNTESIWTEMSEVLTNNLYVHISLEVETSFKLWDLV